MHKSVCDKMDELHVKGHGDRGLLNNTLNFYVIIKLTGNQERGKKHIIGTLD